MNEAVKKELSEFATGIREWLPGHKWLARSAISVRTDSSFVILHARASLRINEPTGPQKAFRLETTSLVAVADVVPAQDHFRNALLDLEQGQLEVAGTLHKLLRNLSNTMWQVTAYHSPYSHPSQPSGPRLPTVILSAGGKHSVLGLVGGQQALDWEVRAAQTPFLSLEELVRFLGFDPTGEARIELTAQFPGLIAATSTLSRGIAEIRANVAPGVERDAFQLGYIAYRIGATPIRSYIPGTQASWTDHGEYSEAVFRFEVKDYPTLAVFLSYKGAAVHDAQISDPLNPANSRQAAYAVVDDGLVNLRKYLLGEGSRPERDLEFAVACVFHLAGLSAMRFGDMDQFRNFSDVVGFTSSGRVVIAEVTLGPIDANGKLSKLAGRAFEVGQRLAQMGGATNEVLPMIVTVLPRGAIRGDLEKAKKLGIAVIAKEELQGIAAQSAFNLDSDRAFELFKKQVPS